MSKIIKLDKNLANQIAAGEVVERPISVIKELVENSIDAGSTNIKIEIAEGGVSYISITDNGTGIDTEDLELVVEKYSTSKIKDLQDLYNVMTFGFRGEAMASISSVSKMEIISNNSCLKVIGGDKENITQVACENGTKIVVEDLFYNTPARLNYLKKPRTEYNHILNYLYEVALSYPKVGFEFISDSKQIFLYRENEDLQTRIYNIYGNDFSENLLEVNFEMVGIKVTGYISDPKVSFSNRNRQNLFVNSRPIKSFLITKSITDAYNRFIPHGTHGAFVLNLEIDPTQVDVNVHPRKLEVRFANEQNIFRAVYHAVQEKLDKVSLVNTDNFPQSQPFPQGEKGVNIPSPSGGGLGRGTGESSSPQYYTGSGTKFKSYSPYKDTTPNPAQGQIKEALNFSREILDTDNPLQGGEQRGSLEFHNSDTEDNLETSNDLHYTALGKIIGQAHNSYIIVQTDEGIKFLDQHALAERIIYEKLVRADKKVSTQGLLIGESLSIMPKEVNILEDNLDTFSKMGFDFEIMPGNIVIINGIPDFIKKENLSNIFLGILEDIGTQNFTKSNTLEEVTNKIYAYTACRSAIKFGHKLNLFEMNKLLNESITDYSATCPHGRPVVFDISLKELQDKYER